MHTPASVDYQQPEVTTLDILRRAEACGLDMIAFTDHNSVRGYADLWREIEDLELLEYVGRIEPRERERLDEYRRLLDKIQLLPGFEFTATFGFHILAIFPRRTSVRMMEHLLLMLGVPEERFGSSEVGATTDVIRAYKILNEHGALVIGAHVNSTNGVAMQGLRFGGQTKIAYTQDTNLHALEVTDLALGAHRRSTARFFNGSKPEYSRRMHCIQGSDAHRLEHDPQRESNLGVGDRATEALLPEASFEAFKALLVGEEFDRIRSFVPQTPLDAVQVARAEGNTATQAFHERMSTKRSGMSPILQDLVAFANTAGGTIYAGASPIERRPIAGILDAAAAREELSREISQQISPPPPISIDVLSSRDKSVLAVRVEKGEDAPYALEPGAVFVRRDGESVKASRDEIVAMIRSTASRSATSVAPVPTPPASSHANGYRRGSSAPALPAVDLIVSESEAPERANGRAPAQETAVAVAVVPSGIVPTNGVEIVGEQETDQHVQYALRDLRNQEITSEVTRDSPRRLWRYAIRQHEEHHGDDTHITWEGDYGYWRGYRPRGGVQRYNLAFRGEGELRLFYGVTEEGVPVAWREIIPGLRPVSSEDTNSG